MDILKTLRSFVEGNPSVRRVADDVELTSELILLVRMMFADGELKTEEMANFERLCETAFGIPVDDVPQVLQFLCDFAYETSAAAAAQMFTELPDERKRALLLHMLSVAKSDHELHDREAEMLRRTAAVLGLSAAQIATMRAD